MSRRPDIEFSVLKMNKKRLQLLLPKSSFMKNVATLMSGTVFAQVLLILVAPILTRLYSPEDFGVYAIYISVAGVFAAVPCLCYEFAIVSPEKDEDAANVLALAILICLGMCCLVALCTYFFRKPIASLFKSPDLAQWLWFIPLSFLVIGFFQAFNYWSTRRKQFKRLAVRQVTNSTITAFTQVGLGKLLNPPNPGGLIGGALVGQSLATVRLAGQIAKDEGEQIISALSIKRIKEVAVRYRNFPLFTSPSLLLSVVSNMLPAILLGYFFSMAVVGFFSLGYRVLSAPLTVIGSSLTQVFFPQATEANRDDELANITLKAFEQLVKVGMTPFILLAIAAPELFAIVFGHEWLIAGEYVRYMSIWLFLHFITTPLAPVYMIVERQERYLFITSGLLIGRILALVIGGLYNNAILAIQLFSLIGAIMYLSNGLNIMNLTGIRIKVFFAIIVKALFNSTPFILLPVIMWFLSGDSTVLVVIAVASGLVFLTKIIFDYIR